MDERFREDSPSRDALVRDALERASGSPRLARRDELLASLVARIEDGGADVADAPLPRPMLTLVADVEPETPVAATPHRRRGGLAAKAAGVGVAGWIAIAAGTAAAATAGALLLLTPGDDGTRHLPPTTHPGTENSTTQASPPGNHPGGGDGIVPDDGIDQLVPDIEDPRGLLPERIGSGGGLSDALNPDGLLPDGTVADTLAPVLSALDTSGLTSGLLDLAACEGSAQVRVTASDDVGVTTVSLRLTASGLSLQLPMSQTSGDTWTASVAPVALSAVTSILGDATVTVEARDAAGNVASTSTKVPLSALVCLG